MVIRPADGQHEVVPLAIGAFVIYYFFNSTATQSESAVLEGKQGSCCCGGVGSLMTGC